MNQLALGLERSQPLCPPLEGGGCTCPQQVLQRQCTAGVGHLLGPEYHFALALTSETFEP